MGYASTNIIHFGVKLNRNQTIKLEQYFKDKGILENLYELGHLEMDDEHITKYPCLENNPEHIDGIEQTRFDKNNHRYNTDREIHQAEVRSEDTNSTIHNDYFDLDATNTHYFGIYCGSNGYGYSDDIQHIMNDIPIVAQINFEKYCRPILEKCDINIEPSVQLFNQVW